MPKSVGQRFWSKVDIRGSDECWPWLASRDKNGYGKFGLPGGKTWTRAHRVAFELAYGIALGSLLGRHTCDNPWCCNPSHIIPGTQNDNIQDMVSRGRHSGGGPRKACTKLTENQVMEMRSLMASGLSTYAAAKRFGISQGQASRIKRGKLWKRLMEG